MTDLSWLASTLASDATEGEGVLPGWIHPLSSELRIAGRICTATASPDTGRHLLDAIARGPEAGPVLVVAGASDSRRACIGGNRALELVNKGFHGFITDGRVRDAAEIRESGLKVWCRGLSPSAPLKDEPGSVGMPIVIGEVEIHDGDFLIADEDGIVVWPQSRFEDLLARAHAKLEASRAESRS